MTTLKHKIHFKPHAHQYDAYNAALKYYATWLCGGIGSGKTYLQAQWVYAMATQHAPGVDGLLVFPDFDSFWDIFMPTWRQIVPGEGTLWKIASTGRTSSKQLVIYSGQRSGGLATTTVYVRSAMNKQTVQRIDGLPTIGWAAIDEPARMLCGKAAWEKTLGRIRKPTPVGNHVLLVGSPRGLGHWTCDAFGLDSDHPSHGYSVGYESPTKPGYFVRACRTESNEAFLGDGYADKLRQAYGEQFAAQELGASLIRTEGQIFPDWNRSIHVLPHDVARELWQRKARAYCFGVDWGWTNPGVVLCCAKTADDELIVIDEWYESQRQTHEQGYNAARMRRLHSCSPGTVAYCDPSEPQNIALWNGGFNWKTDRERVASRGADNAWQAGIDVLRNLMHLRRPLDHPAHPPMNRLGRPSLFVSDRCTNLIREMGSYVQLPLKEGQAPREGAQGDDHAIDALRYAALGLFKRIDYSGVRANI